MNFSLLKEYTTALMLFTWWTMASNLQAQQVQIQMESGMNESTASSPEEMQSFMKVHIENMESISALNAKQVGKLNLAAKIVSNKIFEELKPMLAAPFEENPEHADLEESFSDQDSESHSDSDVEKKGLREIMMPVDFETALKHKMWTKAVDSILTEEQKGDLQTHQEQRKNKVREIAVQYRVWQLAERLQLREPQIQLITEIVDRIEGARLTRAFYGDSSFIMGGEQPKSVAADDVQEILSDEQLTLFKRQFEAQHSSGLGAMLGLKPKKDKGKFGIEFDSESDQLIIKSVVKDSSAEKLGLQSGDIIDEINGDPVDTLLQVKRALQKAEEETSLTVIRDGKVIQLELQR